MDSFLTRLNEALRAGFEGAEPRLEVPYEDRVGGILSWQGFAGKDQIDRQRQLSAFLRQTFSQEELQRITAIFAVTPNELRVVESEEAEVPSVSEPVAA
jgi:hypothetical protein